MFCLCLNVSVRKVCVLCTLSINRFILDPICDVALLNSGWLVYCWFHDFGLLLSLRGRFYVCSICYSLNHYTHVHITGVTNQLIQHSRGKNFHYSHFHQRSIVIFILDWAGKICYIAIAEGRFEIDVLGKVYG